MTGPAAGPDAGATDAVRLDQAARAAMARRDAAAARRATDELIARHPDFAPGWLTASVLALDLGQAGRALAAADQGLRLAPRQPALLIQRLRCLAAAARTAEALASMAAAEAAVGADPRLSTSWATPWPCWANTRARWSGCGGRRKAAGRSGAEVQPGHCAAFHGRLRRSRGPARPGDRRPSGRLGGLGRALSAAQPDRHAQSCRRPVRPPGSAAGSLAGRGRSCATPWPRNTRIWARTTRASPSWRRARPSGGGAWPMTWRGTSKPWT